MAGRRDEVSDLLRKHGATMVVISVFSKLFVSEKQYTITNLLFGTLQKKI